MNPAIQQILRGKTNVITRSGAGGAVLPPVVIGSNQRQAVPQPRLTATMRFMGHLGQRDAAPPTGRAEFVSWPKHHSTRTSPTQMNDTHDSTPAAKSAQARSMAATLAAQTGRSFTDCWNSLREAYPSLFNLRDNEDGISNRCLVTADDESEAIEKDYSAPMPAPRGATLTQVYHMGGSPSAIRNRLERSRQKLASVDAPLESSDLHDAIMQFRHDHGIATYDQARTMLRNRHPGYFGL
jgi:hypothetical protein